MNTVDIKIINKALQDIFDNIEHNLSIMDNDLNILWINRAYSERLGLNIGEILGKKCYELWHKRYSPCDNCPCVKAIETGNIEIEEKPTNEGSYYIITAIPIKENGNIKKVFEIGKEITEKKLVAEKFLEVIKLEAVYEIIDNLAHQFNNIFNGIYGFAQLLMQRTESAETLNFINKLMDSVEKGLKFIKALLNLKTAPSEMKVFDLNLLIISMKEIIKDIVNEDIKLEFALSKETLLIKGDSLQLKEVLRELVQNAKNAISERGTIIVSTEKTKIDSEEKIVLTISDTGHGMSEEVIKRCFEPLFTNDPRRFGLGLSIVKNIIQKHNGFIEINSSPQQGTTIKVFFPSITLQPKLDT